MLLMMMIIFSSAFFHHSQRPFNSQTSHKSSELLQKKRQPFLKIPEHGCEEDIDHVQTMQKFAKRNRDGIQDGKRTILGRVCDVEGRNEDDHLEEARDDVRNGQRRSQLEFCRKQHEDNMSHKPIRDENDEGPQQNQKPLGPEVTARGQRLDEIRREGVRRQDGDADADHRAALQDAVDDRR